MNTVTGRFLGRTTRAALCAALVLACGAAAGNDADAVLERQRDLFRTAYDRAELGDWSAIETLPAPDRRLLADYVLWPDLEAAYLRAAIRTLPAERVETFLARYGDLKPARELRYRYALELVRRGDLAGYEAIYTAWYADFGDPQLDCLALAAGIAAGRGEQGVERARQLWRVGHSQVDECDPVFAWMKANGELRPEDYRARFDLALEAGEFQLARWLARSIDDAHVAIATQWLAAQADPASFLARHAGTKPAPGELEQLAYAATRLTYADPDRANALWQPLAQRLPADDPEGVTVARHIALWTARDKLPAAAARLAALPTAAIDDEVLRWRARTALGAANWHDVLESIAAMPEAERTRDEWRYWRAVAGRATGDAAGARATLEKLAAERGYYGFLAADELDRDYAFDHAALATDAARIAALESQPALVRARELYRVGQDGRGRSEWDAATAGLSAPDKLQAALLAHRWGWHSRAIATVATIGEFDDLNLRYPLPHRDDFQRAAAAASIPSTWAYGIARSESLFMPDIRSGAGAIGVMQLLPGTGRDMARSLNLPFAGIDTLTDPEANIRLGAAYLGEMLERFDGNRVLATAAYNAGPLRVEQWVPVAAPVDARIWIENIPYNETRSYVRRVLEAETIFHWRLTGKTRRLTDEFVAVEPRPAPQGLASVSR